MPPGTRRGSKAVEAAEDLSMPLMSKELAGPVTKCMLPNEGQHSPGRPNTGRRYLCSSGKSHIEATKEAALSAHATVALPLLNSRLEREVRQSPLKTACQNSHAPSSTSFPGTERVRWAQQSMRSILMEARCKLCASRAVALPALRRTSRNSSQAW